ncbi:MAG: glycosyltransferase family 2 protein [Pseudomonadota bacterium]
MGRLAALATAYGLRWRRRRLLARAISRRGQLVSIRNRTQAIEADTVLAFATMRNERLRLDRWLDHHRELGIGHFLVADNGSDDGTRERLAQEADVSLWAAEGSYKAARFGMDWLTLLLARYGHGYWCLTLDADELFVYPHHTTRDLVALTRWLDMAGHVAVGALMLDLYPRGRLGAIDGGNDLADIPWFDAGNYVSVRQERLQNLWVQGGPRARVFFAEEPRRAPTLSKIPLVRWNRRFAYVSSTHSLLPRRLNRGLGIDDAPTGVLLHTKFLADSAVRARTDKARKEHFENSDLYGRYYDALMTDPVLWCETSTRFHGWRQLEGLGLMSRGAWG